jgi:hypothetical protein
VLNRNAFQLDSFEAANIDCGDPIALWIDAFSARKIRQGTDRRWLVCPDAE